MFDEPSSYLDVKQRLKAAATIRNILTGEEGGERETKSRTCGRPDEQSMVAILFMSRECFSRSRRGSYALWMVFLEQPLCSLYLAFSPHAIPLPLSSLHANPSTPPTPPPPECQFTQRSATSWWWSTISPSWTTCRTSSAVSTGPPPPTAW